MPVFRTTGSNKRNYHILMKKVTGAKPRQSAEVQQKKKALISRIWFRHLMFFRRTEIISYLFVILSHFSYVKDYVVLYGQISTKTNSIIWKPSKITVSVFGVFFILLHGYLLKKAIKKAICNLTNYCRSTCGILVNLMWMNDLTLDHVFAQFLLSVQDDLAKTEKWSKAHYKTRWK